MNGEVLDYKFDYAVTCVVVVPLIWFWVEFRVSWPSVHSCSLYLLVLQGERLAVALCLTSTFCNWFCAFGCCSAQVVRKMIDCSNECWRMLGLVSLEVGT
ncbi:hypothetical protein BD289DRAFT_430146 [Coniella lustricola]|uniref:Transmembrane protein n=1 Tax=Coniella lustricola TaxID=2025994 RepID=A0A2T3ACD3_9PEZI|nr:hypothetical protein BD289DRAFT_430146 [Coniella lustricola]